MRAIEFFADAILQSQLFGVAIEKIAFAGFSVAERGNQQQTLVLGGCTESDFFARQFLLQQLVISFECFVFPVNSIAVIVSKWWQ